MLQAHYRSPLDFSNEALKAAEKGYKRLMNAVDSIKKITASDKSSVDVNALKEKCFAALNDDMNTPILISHLFEGVKIINTIISGKESIDKEGLKELTKLYNDFAFDILGLLPSEESNSGNNETLEKLVETLIEIRKTAKANKDWATADAVRDKFKEAGIEIKDTAEGVEWKLAN